MESWGQAQSVIDGVQVHERRGLGALTFVQRENLFAFVTLKEMNGPVVRLRDFDCKLLRFERPKRKHEEEK